MSQPLYPTPAPHFPAPPANVARAPWIAARIAVVALGVFAVLDTINTMLGFASYEHSISALRAGARVTPGLLDVAVAVGALLDIAVLLATAVAFITWLFLARRNLDRVGQDAEWRPGWAIGGWFVPIGWLYIPYKVTADVRDNSVPYDRAMDLDQPAAPHAPVGRWWASYLVMIALSYLTLMATGTQAKPDVTVEMLVSDRPVEYGVGLLSAAATIVAAVLASLVVLRITKAQEMCAELEAAKAARHAAATYGITA